MHTIVYLLLSELRDTFRSCVALQLELMALRGDGRRHLWSLVAGIGEDGLDEGERPARRAKQLAGAVAVLHVGGMDDDAQQQAERIDEDVALAPRDLLARIEALRVERSPPFCAPLALWLSITAADGLASRPSRSRTIT